MGGIARSQRRAGPGWITTLHVVAAVFLSTLGAVATVAATFTWRLGVLDLDIDRAETLSPWPYIAFYGGIAAGCFVLAGILALRVRRALGTHPRMERDMPGRISGYALVGDRRSDSVRR